MNVIFLLLNNCCEMKISNCLLLLGFLVLFSVTSNADHIESESLPEQISSLKFVRDAVPKRNNKKQQKKKRRNIKKNKKRKNQNTKKNKKRKNKNQKKTSRVKKPIGRNRKNNRRKEATRIEGRSIDGKCLESAMIALKRWKDVVSNFEKQSSRIQKQTSIATKKSSKKNVFGPIARKLIDVGGGNKSALSCAGSADNAGAQQLANLTTILLECEKEVNSSCDPINFPKPNMTLIEGCSNYTKSFKKESQKCLDLSKEDTAANACACWTSDDMSMLNEAVKNCKITEVGDIAKGLKACKAAFSNCRKYEDDAVTSVAACSQNVDKIKEKAETLTKNKDALTNVKDKISQIRGTTSRVAAESCKDFVALVTLGK